MERWCALIVETNVGHVPTYARIYASIFRQLGLKVILVGPPRAISACEPSGPSAVEHANFKRAEQLRRVPLPQVIHSISGRVLPWAEVFYRWMKLSLRLRRRPEFVFFADLDGLLLKANLAAIRPMLRLLVPYSWMGVMTHPDRFLPQGGQIGLRRTVLFSDRSIAFFTVDENATLAQLVDGRRVITVPETSDMRLGASGRALAGKIAAFAQRRRILSLSGALHPRKGVKQFFRLCRLLPEEWCFVIAGSIEWQAFQSDAAVTSKLKDLEAQNDPRIFLHTSYLVEEEMNAIIDASDVIFALYPGFVGSSNVLTKAAHFEKPVLCSADAPTMASRVAEYKLGKILDAEFTDLTKDELAFFSGPREYLKANGPDRFADYLEMHSDRRLLATMKSVLASIA